MLPDRVSNPGPLSYESVALPIALHDPACMQSNSPLQNSLTGVLSDRKYLGIRGQFAFGSKEFLEYLSIEIQNGMVLLEI